MYKLIYHWCNFFGLEWMVLPFDAKPVGEMMIRLIKYVCITVFKSTLDAVRWWAAKEEFLKRKKTCEQLFFFFFFCFNFKKLIKSINSLLTRLLDAVSYVMLDVLGNFTIKIIFLRAFRILPHLSTFSLVNPATM